MKKLRLNNKTNKYNTGQYVKLKTLLLPFKRGAFFTLDKRTGVCYNTNEANKSE